MKAVAVPNIYTRQNDFSRADMIVYSMSEIEIGLLKALAATGRS
jgi:hypothetical protein